MKKILVFAILLSGGLMLHAQEPMFVKGDRVANIGLGLSYYGMGSITLEQCVYDGILDKGSIGVGIYGGAGYRLRGDAARFIGGVRGTFHYPFIEKFDTYIGIGGGLRYTYWFHWYDNTFGPDIDGFLGARYSFTDNLKLFLEVGSSLGYLVGGISLSF